MKEVKTAHELALAIEHLRKTYRIKERITPSDTDYLKRGGKVGDIITREPEYKTTEEAYRLLTDYYGKQYFYIEQNLFFEKVKVLSQGFIKGELERINQFIQEAMRINAVHAADSYNKYGGNDKKLVYIRLKEGFYQSLEVEKYPELSSIGLDEAVVYGRYFLFKEYLENKLQEFGIPTVESLLAPGKQLNHVAALEEILDRHAVTKKWRESKIQVAAFCNLLYQMKYFKAGPQKWAKACLEFAFIRYHLEIDIQLQPSKRVDRAKHMADMKKAIKI